MPLPFKRLPREGYKELAACATSSNSSFAITRCPIIEMLLSRFPHVHLAHLPTPLERLPRLSKFLGGPHLWVKRDDCTGLGMGGNKVRKLEFVLGEAMAQGADVVISCGPLQSNHARQTAAATAKLGLECHLFLQDRGIRSTPDYRRGGNALLDQIFGATIHMATSDADLAIEMDRYAEVLKANGRKPFVVPLGGSNLAGYLGYVKGALEITQQANQQGISIDHLIVALGTAGTQGGLIAGLHSINSSIGVTGISILPHPDHVALAADVANQTLRHLGVTTSVSATGINVETKYLGGGYGQLTDGVREAIDLAGKLEGLLLDPVYTGKAMSGLIGMIREGRFPRDSNIVFMHTGGIPGVFAYREDLATDW